MPGASNTSTSPIERPGMGVAWFSNPWNTDPVEEGGAGGQRVEGGLEEKVG